VLTTKEEEAMQEPTWEAVLKRLDSLEQEHAKWKQTNYCWKLLGVAAVFMLGLIVLLGATTAKLDFIHLHGWVVLPTKAR
jgi:hypothetical protein